MENFSTFFYVFNIVLITFAMLVQAGILVWAKKYTKEQIDKEKFNNKMKELIYNEVFKKKFSYIIINFIILYIIETIVLGILITQLLNK